MIKFCRINDSVVTYPGCMTNINDIEIDFFDIE